ncbi:MAG TPA: hypothetical protein VG326_05985 [Tepidisphaeraceae bacterium]|nr:hypothetical protein [Tepidisphaeraceae bacterium]
MDRALGYHGGDRFVCFYHEPRALEVLWRDRYSYGFSTGAWITFMDDVAPIAAHYGANVGCQGIAATHVLFIDRSAATAYFAERTLAVQFLSRLANQSLFADTDAADAAGFFERIVEITPVEIDKLARRMWNEKLDLDLPLPVWSDAAAGPGISIASAIHHP